jgi:gas vesicle protein
MARNDDSGGGATFAAFMLGALAGAALALMYAPAAGDETRRKLAEKAREGRDQANRAFERGKSAFEKARQQAAGATAGTEDAL